MISSRKFFAVSAAVVLLAAVLARPALSSKPKGRLLVLGFESRQLNDVQDRLLRETVMRHLSTEGFSIVPVMEIESLFNDDQNRLIRKVKRSEVRALCDELGAGFAFFGRVEPEDGKREHDIKPGKNYICSLTLYRKDGNRFVILKLKVAGDASLYRFYNALSKTIVAKLDATL